MSDFFMLACYAPPGDDCRALGPAPRPPGVTSWRTGAQFGVAIEEPLRFEWLPEPLGVKKALYDATIPLLRGDLVAALRTAGVDNLQTYRAEIRDTLDGSVDRDYQAVNVIGVIAAADMAKSKFTAHSSPALIDVDFDSLVIDPAKARGQKLFRLAECVSGVAIHRVVKEHLESKGGFGLTFVPPEQWVG
jgi:hypothetical protein